MTEENNNNLEQLSDEDLERSLRDETPVTDETAETDTETDENPSPTADETKETAEDQAGSEGEGSGKADESEADISHTRQFQGVLEDARRERQRRQELEQKLEELRAESPKKVDEATGGEGGDDDDDRLLTRAEMKAMLAEYDQRLAQQRQVQEMQSRLVSSEAAAVKELTAEACGDGLDFTSVLTAGKANLTEADKVAIALAENPAKEAYRRCILLTPELQERQVDRMVAKRLAAALEKEKAKSPGKAPVDRPKPKVSSDEAQDFTTLSDAELEEELRKG